MEDKLLEEFNDLINSEFQSAYLYFAMSTYFDEIYMGGFGTFMKNEAVEKLGLAQKLYDYLILRDEKLVFSKIDEPESDWINLSDVFSIALSHEEFMLEKVKKIYALANSFNDIGVIECLGGIIRKHEITLSKIRKMVFRIKNSNIISTNIEIFNKSILDESIN